MMNTFCVEAEEALLSAIVLDNSIYQKAQVIPNDAFYLQEHRHIFSAMGVLLSSGLVVDAIGICSVLKSTLPGIVSFIESLLKKHPSKEVDSHIAIILAKHQIRQSVSLYSELSDLLLSGKSPDEVNKYYSDRTSATLLAPPESPKHISELLGNYRETIKGRISGLIKPISTGHPELDKKLCGGFNRGTLVITAARPAMGKTALSLSIARNASKVHKVLFLSMEMSLDQILDRNIAALSRLPIGFLTNPNKDDTRWERVKDAYSDLSSRHLYIDDQPGLTIPMIVNKCKTLSKAGGIDLLVIDQLSMISGSPRDKMHETICDYTRSLVKLSKELNICVLLVCQLNRECEKRINRRPILSDLAMSSSIEQDADTVMMLYRDDFYNKNSDLAGKIEVSVVKQRQGPTGTVYFNYIGPQTRFEDIEGVE